VSDTYQRARTTRDRGETAHNVPTNPAPGDANWVQTDETPGEKAASGAQPHPRRSLYPWALRLRHVQPSAWQRAVFGEGAVVAAALLVMADLASAWTLVVLPVAVAGLVKTHDLLAGVLATSADPARDGADHPSCTTIFTTVDPRS